MSRYSGGLTAARDGSLSSDHASFSGLPSPYTKQACMLFEGNSSNPNYHQLTDSVDTANYVDYTYATKMTRSAVGFLAESAVLVPEPASLSLLTVSGLLVLFRRRKAR